MYFINLLIDGEPCEVELSLNDIYSKCIKCGTIYRQFFPPKNYSITGRQRRATLSLRIAVETVLMPTLVLLSNQAKPNYGRYDLQAHRFCDSQRSYFLLAARARRNR